LKELKCNVNGYHENDILPMLLVEKSIAKQLKDAAKGCFAS